MADVSVTHNLGQVGNWFEELAGDIDVLYDDILKTAANYETRVTKQRFTKQLSADGVPWPPLSPLTIAARRSGPGRAGRGTKRLQGAGILRGSIVPHRTKKNEIKVWTPLSYAIYQQEGATWIITKKQAWWMVFNLYGFNPDSPWEWGLRQNAQFSRKQLEGDQSLREYIGDRNWKKASNLARKLTGGSITIPATGFMGISEEDADAIEKIAQRHVDRYLKRRGRG